MVLIQRKVILVGTSHEFQKRKTCQGDPVPIDVLAKFMKRLHELIEIHNPAGVAEEMCREGMRRAQCMQTTVQEVASSAGLQDCLCEPELCEWSEMGISEQEIYLEEHFPTRERAWINRLCGFDKWPVLFICGDLHVDGFSTRLEKWGIKVEIAERNWTPDQI